MSCFWFFTRQSCYELRFCANVRETSKRTKSQWHGTRQSYRKLKIFQTIGKMRRRCIVYAIRHSLRGDCGKSGPFSCKCPRISLEIDLAVSCEERRRCFDPRYDRNYIDRVDVSLRLLHRYTRVHFFLLFAKNFSKRNIAYSEVCSIFIVLTRQEFQLKAEVETPLSIRNYLSLTTL